VVAYILKSTLENKMCVHTKIERSLHIVINIVLFKFDTLFNTFKFKIEFFLM